MAGRLSIGSDRWRLLVADRYDWRLVRAAYRKKASDREIARRFGMHHSAVAYWRKRSGLPPNRRRRPNGETANAVRVLLAKGLKSREIADTGLCQVAYVNRVKRADQLRSQFHGQHLGSVPREADAEVC